MSLKKLAFAFGAALALIACETTPTPPPPVDPPEDPAPVAGTLPNTLRFFSRSVSTKRDYAAGAPLALDLTTAQAASFDLSVGADDAGTGVAGPVSFTWEGGPPIVALTPPYVSSDTGVFSMGAGVHTIEVQDNAGNIATVVVTVTDVPPPPDPDPDPPTPRPKPIPGSFGTQVGSWQPIQSNAEMPFINVAHATQTYLCDQTECNGAFGTQDYYDAGAVDPVTMLPQRILGNVIYMMPLLTSATDTSGEWVMEWQGDADIEIHGLPNSAQQRSGNRVDFITGTGSGHIQVKVTRIGQGGLQKLAVFLKNDEADYRAGQVYTDRFLQVIRAYRTARAMDLQWAYRWLPRSIDDVADFTTLNWANMDWNSLRRCAGCEKWFHVKQSLPFKALFALPKEAGVELWAHYPVSLGSTTTVSQAGGPDAWAGAIAAEKDAIWQSVEWARYSDAFVGEMIASGYPENRTLYLELSNEIWNKSGAFKAATMYAQGIGDAIDASAGLRGGLGALTAKMAIEFDAALARAGRNQKVVFVVAGQASSAWTTAQALKYYKAEIERQGGDWNSYADRTTVAVAGYFGGTQVWEQVFGGGSCNTPFDSNPANKAYCQSIRDQFEAEIQRDPDALMLQLRDKMLNAAPIVANKAWVIRQLKAHDAEARKFGLALTVLYEGGPHDDEPRPFWRMFGQDTARVLAFHAEFGRRYWGEINNEVADAIIAAFPGILISNYATVGRFPDSKQPWFDCLYGQTTGMCDSWDRLNALSN